MSVSHRQLLVDPRNTNKEWEWGFRLRGKEVLQTHPDSQLRNHPELQIPRGLSLLQKLIN